MKKQSSWHRHHRLSKKNRLQLIHDICCGYDGCTTPEELRGLIDEVRCIAGGAMPGHKPDCEQENIHIKKADCPCAEIYRKVNL